MAAKKTQKSMEYGDTPKTIDDRPFYHLSLDDDQKKFVNAVLNPDNTIIFVNAKAGIKLDNIETLFTKFDEKVVLAEFEEIAKKAAEEKKAAQAKIEAANEKEELITIDYLDKIKLKVAKVLEAERVEGSEKLLKLKVSLGTEERQIVAGLQKYYAPEELVGKNVVIVANLKPAKLKGIESQGMVLAAGDDIVKVITTDGEMKAGAEVC
jgi:methionyl-tRNA synthetase